MVTGHIPLGVAGRSPSHSVKERLSQGLEKDSYISSEQESMNDLSCRRTAVPGDMLPIKELQSLLHRAGTQKKPESC